MIHQKGKLVSLPGSSMINFDWFNYSSSSFRHQICIGFCWSCLWFRSRWCCCWFSWNWDNYEGSRSRNYLGGFEVWGCSDIIQNLSSSSVSSTDSKENWRFYHGCQVSHPLNSWKIINAISSSYLMIQYNVSRDCLTEAVKVWLILNWWERIIIVSAYRSLLVRELQRFQLLTVVMVSLICIFYLSIS